MTSLSQFPSDSYSYLSPKTSSSPTSQATCNSCKRLLYSFEEVLVCRVCHGSYHRRCLKNEPYSRYGNYEKFICESCQHPTSPTTTTTTTTTTNNNNNKSRAIDSDEYDSDESPSRNRTKPFEQIQTHLTSQTSDLDDYLPTSSNKQNGQYHDDDRTSSSRTQQQQQQQQDDLDSDEENYEQSTMFHANYQYTPLKDYAASKGQSTNHQSKNRDVKDSPTVYSNQESKPRYGGGLQYSDHGYDPVVTRAVDAPSLRSNQYSSPTVDNLSAHNRQHSYISTTSLTVNEKPIRQQNTTQLPPRTFVHSHSPQIHEKSVSHSQLDRYSTTGSDSGVGTVTSISNNHSRSQQEQLNQNSKQEVAEEKFTNLVQELGKQFELGTQKLNEKLEKKLKDLEEMINRQTFIIQRQDQVIDDLKKQILQIENERDNYRQRLSLHEQPDEPPKTTNPLSYQIEHPQQIERKVSQASTIVSEISKTSAKKNPAPRIESQRVVIYDERSPSVSSKPVKKIIEIRKRADSSVSSTSSASSTSEKLASSVPIAEPSPASNRLDHIINQSTTKEQIAATTSSTGNYSLPQVRRQDRPHLGEPISMEQQQVISSVHYDDSDDDNDNGKPPAKTVPKPKNSVSSSSSSSIRVPASKTKSNPVTKKQPTNLVPNKFPSFETLQESFQTDQEPRLSAKTGSLQFGKKPMQDDDASSIHLTPVESNYPAIQANAAVKGWLRKQNRESFLKRIERYYCVLATNALLMHRNEQDRTPQKAINLRGAKVFYYDDLKYGPSLELTWSSLAKDEKHYHLYAPNPQEAERWVRGIQTVIHNLENRISGNVPKKRYP